MVDTEETQGAHVFTPKPGQRGMEGRTHGQGQLPTPASQDTNGSRSHRPGRAPVPLVYMHGPQLPLLCPTMAFREGASFMICPLGTMAAKEVQVQLPRLAKRDGTPQRQALHGGSTGSN